VRRKIKREKCDRQGKKKERKSKNCMKKITQKIMQK
jgi:hypothetical protein